MASSPSKRTKIVCTIGPASEEAAMLARLVRAGMNVCRLNMSHGTHAWHRRTIRTIRNVAKQTGEPLAILADLQGPKIRVGELPKEGVVLAAGKSVTFTTATMKYDGKRIPVTYRQLHNDIKSKHRILLDDGLLEVRVTKVRGRDIACVVVTGGTLTSHKGMNLPDTRVAIPALTVKDRVDAVFAIERSVDWIALSFVRAAKDVLQLRQLIQQAGGRQKIIVKIEKPEAITNFAEILKAADGVMVARGDLGVEIPAAEVPIHQKTIIEKARAAGKPVVVATQMLDSMIRNPRPTRAEVSDVANAIIDHADAVMLSGESATGKYPLEAVRMLAGIAHETEASPLDDVAPQMPPPEHWDAVDVVAETAALLAAHARVHGILVATATGQTARRIARFRPQTPLFAATMDPVTQRQLQLSYGIRPVVLPRVRDRAAFLRHVRRSLAALRGTSRSGAWIVVTGEPWGHPGTANSVAIERMM